MTSSSLFERIKRSQTRLAKAWVLGKTDQFVLDELEVLAWLQDKEIFDIR